MGLNLLLIVMTVFAVHTAVTVAAGIGSNRTTFRAGFVYHTNRRDMGWTWRHNLGVVQMHRDITEAYPGMNVSIEYVENIDDEDGCTPIFQQWGQKSFDLIVGTSFGYEECLVEAAAKFPNSMFLHVSGSKRATPNFAVGYARIYQPIYLAGFTAGLSTRSNVLCIVGPLRIPETFRHLSAWILGATRANPTVTVHVVWTGSWMDPILEAWIVRQLRGLDCDVVCVRANSVDVYETASELGMLATGFNSDYRMLVGESVLVSAEFNWGFLYTQAAKMAIEGTFVNIPPLWWPGWDEDSVDLTDFSFLIPTDVIAAVQREKLRMILFNASKNNNGTFSSYSLHSLPSSYPPDLIFCGPINDSRNTLILEQGRCMTNAELFQITWLPRGAIDHGFWLLPSRACLPNEYGDWDFATLKLTCRTCPDGMVPINQDSVSQCRACPSGTYSFSGFQLCTPCSPGTFNAQSGAGQCQSCPSGSITRINGSISCVACPNGMRPNDRSTECEDIPKPWIVPVVVVLGATVLLGLVTLAAVRFHAHRCRSRILAAAPQGIVTLVFTDIQGSTNIWDAAPELMKDSLELHNYVIRHCLLENHGYEVKTEGDSFMIAFWNTDDAVEFCLSAQQMLVNTKWPPGLESFPECQFVESKDPDAILFNGLRVRMGIHVGCPDVEFNPETLRADYFGPMVNCTARITSLGVGGQVLMSREAANALSIPRHSSLVLLSLGTVKLRGIVEEKEIVQASSYALMSRTFPNLASFSMSSTFERHNTLTLAMTPARAPRCDICSRPFRCVHCHKSKSGRLSAAGTPSATIPSISSVAFPSRPSSNAVSVIREALARGSRIAGVTGGLSTQRVGEGQMARNNVGHGTADNPLHPVVDTPTNARGGGNLAVWQPLLPPLTGISAGVTVGEGGRGGGSLRVLEIDSPDPELR